MWLAKELRNGLEMNILVEQPCRLIRASMHLGVLFASLSHGSWLTLCHAWYQNLISSA